MDEYEEIEKEVVYRNANSTDFSAMDITEVRDIINKANVYPLDTGLHMWQCPVSEAIFPVKPESIRGYSYKLDGSSHCVLVTDCPVCTVNRHKLLVWRRLI